MASAREYPAVCRCHVCASAYLNRLGTDGKRKYHGLHQSKPEAQSFASREQRENMYFFIALIVRTACRCGDRVEISARARYRPRRPQGGEPLVCHKRATDVNHCHQANILIDSNRCARLADFGLAVVVEESTSRELKGTTRWMAPELMDPDTFGFTGESLKQLPSKGTDIYAIGMTVLEVSTCLHPPKYWINLPIDPHGMSSIQRHHEKCHRHLQSHERQPARQTTCGVL